MEHWDLRTADVTPHQPQVLHSTRGESRSIVIHLPAGERLQDHEVHERAHVVVVEGEIEADGPDGSVRADRGSSSCSTRASATRCGRRPTRGCCSCSRRGPGTGTPAPATEPTRDDPRHFTW